MGLDMTHYWREVDRCNRERGMRARIDELEGQLAAWRWFGYGCYLLAAGCAPPEARDEMDGVLEMIGGMEDADIRLPHGGRRQ